METAILPKNEDVLIFFDSFSQLFFFCLVHYIYCWFFLSVILGCSSFAFFVLLAFHFFQELWISAFSMFLVFVVLYFKTLAFIMRNRK